MNVNRQQGHVMPGSRNQQQNVQIVNVHSSRATTIAAAIIGPKREKVFFDSNNPVDLNANLARETSLIRLQNGNVYQVLNKNSIPLSQQNVPVSFTATYYVRQVNDQNPRPQRVEHVQVGQRR